MTVYRRFLQEPPRIVMSVSGECAAERLPKFWVRAGLVTHEGQVVEGGVSGSKDLEIALARPVSFCKIQVMKTTKQEKVPHFRLRFTVQCYNEQSGFLDVGHIFSHPIEVFSHPTYLRQAAMPAPQLVHIIPDHMDARKDTRICIVGDGFLNTGALRVTVGDSQVHMGTSDLRVHTSKCVLLTIPAGALGLCGTLPVKVSNDGKNYSHALPLNVCF
eukprot:TRINITY_DN20596_c0_g1_i1.p1 TRINITY_DN20596_c0_g1~~TRINITY_DN20596_c0_g1_i1.p1  ORF type:complete len:254 (+),score=74.04 TRINITY_DN20596_c0_g1_i1:117-764(+)